MRKTRPVVVVLTVSPWDEPTRLRRQLATVLARDCDVVYVTLPYGMRKPAADHDRTDGGIRVLSIAGPLVPLRVLARWAPLRAGYERLVARRLMRRLGDLGRIDALLCFTAAHPGLLASFPGARKIYVANDDHASMASDADTAAAIARDEARTIAQCSQVVTVSEAIARKLSPHGKPVQVMYPGHDCEALPLERHAASRIALSVCFFGYIDWRIDFDLLDRLLREGWHVALIGPVVGTAQEVATLKARHAERFDIQPSIPAGRAPELLARYEVLIVPYRYRTAEQAEAMELPNKTFVYFSALRPIVTTWMPNLKLVESGLIYRAANHDDFIASCLRAVEEDSGAQAARRQQIARQNTWEARRATLGALVCPDGPVLPACAP